MATADLASVFRNPTRLVLNPSAGSIGVASPTFPFGGTALGKIRWADWDFAYETRPLVAQEFGSAAGRWVKQQLARLVFTLTDWDHTTIAALVPKVTTSGSYSRVDGGTRPTFLAAINPILVAPFDLSQPALLIPRPIPVIVEPFHFGSDKNAELVVALDATLPSSYSGLPYQLGRIDGLTLS